MVVYLLTCRANGKVYVGKTVQTAEKRWQQHVADSETFNLYLHRAIRKHGASSFNVSILASTNSEIELNVLERKFIAELRANDPFYGYNMTAGGDGGVTPGGGAPKGNQNGRGNKGNRPLLGYHHTLQSLTIMKQKRAGRKPTLGCEFSAASRNRMSVSHQGNTQNQQTRDRIAASLRARNQNVR